MRSRPSAPSTPRSARSKSYKRGRGAFPFDNEHIAIAAAPSESSSSGDLQVPAHVSGDEELMMSDATTKATRNWTPRKSNREYILSPLQSLTPTRLSHALGNIGIATTPSSRSWAGGQGRSSSFLASPQTSFALSSAAPPSATATWKRRRYYFVILVIAISVVVVLRKDVIIDDISTPVATTKTIIRATPGDYVGDLSGKEKLLRGDQQSRGVSDKVFGEQEELSAHESSIIQQTDTNDEDSPDTRRKRLEDGAEATSQSNLIDEENGDITTSTEDEVFNRMLQIARKNKELCGQRQNQLEDFGIIGGIESYLNETASQTGARPKCTHLPPPTSCGARNFTAFIDASLHSVGYGIDPRHQSSHHRTIFILALRMQSVPSASEIIIQYGGSASDLEWDGKYGRRLLMWNDDSAVAVKILFVGDQDQSKFNISSEISNDAVLYVSATMNGVDLNGISTGGLELGFDVWKQYSDTLLAASNGALVQQDNPLNMPKLEASAFNEDCPILNSAGTGTGGESGTQLPFFFHRNYQCLLDHKVFKGLRQFVSAHNFIRNIVGRAGTSPPILFPGLLHKMRSTTSAQHNTTGDARIILHGEAASAVDLDLRRSSENIDVFFGSTLNPVHWCDGASLCPNQFIDAMDTAEGIKLGKNRCSTLLEERYRK